jgi:hypothetical protein
MQHSDRLRKWWIETDIYYCPMCMSEKKYRSRVYDRPRPEQWHERNHIIETWDYCDAF